MKKKNIALICTILALFLVLAGCKGKAADPVSQAAATACETTEVVATACETTSEPSTEVSLQVTIDGTYTGKDEVAAYIYEYACLPSNYITKSEAKKLGWDNSKGNLWDVAPGRSIGGDRFGNYEGLLPDEKGRTYYECDIDYEGGYRGAERIIYSNDGLIYYTEDHYQTFELLYGQE